MYNIYIYIIYIYIYIYIHKFYMLVTFSTVYYIKCFLIFIPPENTSFLMISGVMEWKY